MFLKAGLVSLALLLASRILGLLRDTTQAAAFGASGVGDVVVLMLAAPDWLASVVASGALSYVLLPRWARLGPGAVASVQRQVFRALITASAMLVLLLVLFESVVIDAVLPGISAGLRPTAQGALMWSIAVTPMALATALWATRLQHERDVIGLYGANLVVNLVLVLGLAALAGDGGHRGALAAVSFAGMALVAAMLLRLLWQWWRLQGLPAATDAAAGDIALPGASVWIGAALAAAAPLALPFTVRSLASGQAEGVLALFNYAWKLVELPLGLAVQLVATLAFPAIARALASGARAPAPAVRDHQDPVGVAFVLAWALACAAASALFVGAPAIAGLLFGWGRMVPDDVAKIAEWGALGAWSLPSLALIAVASVVLASLGRLAWISVPHGLALGVAFAAHAAGLSGGTSWMLLMVALQWAVAAGLLTGITPHLLRSLPWREMLIPAGVTLLAAHPAVRVAFAGPMAGLAAAVSAAVLCLLVTVAVSPRVRAVLRP